MNQTEMKWRSRCGKNIVIACGRARELFYTLFYAGITDVYIKDEEYQCTFQYDERDKDFVWEG